MDQINKTLLLPFCADNLRQKKVNAEFAAKCKPLNHLQKTLKTKIENYCIENDQTKLIVETPDLTPKITYISRLTKTVSGRINRDCIEEGLEQFFEQNDELPGDLETIISKLWDCINNARKVDKITLDIKEKPFKDTTGVERITSGELMANIQSFWKSKKALKDLRKQKKEKTNALNERISMQSPAIIKNLNSRHKKSQKINIQHNNTPCSFYIRLKKSAVQPSLKKEQMIQIIRDSVSIGQNKQDIIKNLIERFEQIPKKITEKVTLDKGHYQPVQP